VTPAERCPVLVVTDRAFWRRSQGSEQRIASLLEHLAGRGHRLTVALLGRPGREDAAALERFARACPGLDVRSRSALAGARLGALAARMARVARGVRALGSSSSPSSDPANPLLAEPSPARRAFVDACLRTVRPRAVIVEMTRLTPLVHPRRAVDDPAPTDFLIDTHDVLHERAARYREGGAEVALDVDARQEAAALATYDAILAIQTRDARTLRGLVPHRPVVLVPHGIALPALERPPHADGPAVRAGDGRPRAPVRLGLLAGRDEANLAGLHWFLDRVYGKLVDALGPAVELRVAGRIAERFTREQRGLQMIGPVATIDAFWPEVDVAINPVRFGSGLKIKNVEALAWARPLVTSPIGAEGLEDAAPAGLAIADAPEAWLAVLRAWIADPALRAGVGRAGRAHAERRFAPPVAFAALDAHLAALAPRDRPGA